MLRLFFRAARGFVSQAEIAIEAKLQLAFGILEQRVDDRALARSEGLEESHLASGFEGDDLANVIETLTHVLAKELGSEQITVNAIAPGPVATGLFLGDKSQEQVERIEKMIPLGRLGEPEDIAAAVSFLAGPDSHWISGQVIRANGGMN